MVTLLDQVFKYRLNQRVAFKDALTKRIVYGNVQNRWIDNKKKMYSIKTDVLLTVCELDILGFLKDRNV